MVLASAVVPRCCRAHALTLTNFVLLFAPSAPREWYSYHFPELSKIVNDNIMFARIALYLGRRSTMPADW